MELYIDTHTHSIASGHAFSTIDEMTKHAKNNGIKMIALTDHGPDLLGSASWIYFEHLPKVLPNEINGVRVLKGIEANVLDYEGGLDLREDLLKKLDLVIASLHGICIPPTTIEKHTEVMLKMIQNPFVDIIGHPGNPMYQVDIEKVVRAAKENDKLIEINNHSFVARPGSYQNCKEFALKCKEYGVMVTCGSDSHYGGTIGGFEKIKSLFEEIEMPEELVLCTSIEKVESYLIKRRQRLERI